MATKADKPNQVHTRYIVVMFAVTIQGVNISGLITHLNPR